MKKYVLLLLIIYTMTGNAIAQEVVLTSSFVKFSEANTEIDITNKTVVYIDYPAESLAKGHEVTVGQAKNLVSTLMEDPSKLSKQKMNWIITPEGVVSIHMLDNKWYLFFLSFSKYPGLYTEKGARVFTFK